MVLPVTLLGQKDHGKSTLIGRLIHDTKQQNDYKVVSQSPFAHLIDSLQEEHRRNMTMDTSSAYISIEKKSFELIDVPGHQNLIKHALTGSSRAKYAILVISASEGLTQQAVRHLMLGQMLDINFIIVAINKMDEMGYDGDSCKNLAKRIKKTMSSIGYKPKQYKIIPISALFGENVLRRSDKMKWYKGYSLGEVLLTLRQSSQLASQPLRFMIQDVYQYKSKPLYVGKVYSGVIMAKKKYFVMPSEEQISVEFLHLGNKVVQEAHTGENPGVTFKLSKNSLKRGMVLFEEKFPPRVSCDILADIFLFTKPHTDKITLELGMQNVQIYAKLLTPVDKNKKTSMSLHLLRSLVYDTEKKSPFSRFVIKDVGEIIGVGICRSSKDEKN